jgi:hypothetical protein
MWSTFAVQFMAATSIRVATEKLNRHKSPGIDHIPAEVIKAGGRTIHFEIHKLYLVH